ncbi:hypothetical protein BD779DRAFT_1584802 [Infundibulicybe gibba]|nr:hypothetical protein BD779DRAFT_1584802 [Infundibulicybe gibba]
MTSDVLGSAQSRKPADAELRGAGPLGAVRTAHNSLRLKLNIHQACGRGLSRGFGWLGQFQILG